MIYRVRRFSWTSKIIDWATNLIHKTKDQIKRITKLDREPGPQKLTSGRKYVIQKAIKNRSSVISKAANIRPSEVERRIKS